MAKTSPRHGKNTARTWQEHGKTGETHGRIVARTWQKTWRRKGQDKGKKRHG
jgi:hypothetical protein